jgi:AcrR family transcriptional regulator
VTPATRRAPRKDAQRNRERILQAAREIVAERGIAAKMEDVAARAGVGIGTLYRNFPNRQALLEALYADEVEEVCKAAEQLRDAEPWEALAGWVDRLIAYVATKQALVNELGNNLDPQAALFQNCRGALFTAGEPLLGRAQEAGVVRADVTVGELIHMIMGIAKIPASEPGQTKRLVGIALDGLRYRAES